METMRRAYSTFEVRSADAESGVIEGIATTPTPDHYGDIVEPKGAEYDLPLPLLWQHDSSQPVGQVLAAKVTAAGITVKAQILKAADAMSENLRARLAEAWDSVKMKLVRGFSIGFKPIETSQIEDTYSYRFTAWRWLELSLVTIPANMDATITVVRSIDQEARAASGLRRVVKLDEEILRRARLQHPGAVYLGRPSRSR